MPNHTESREADGARNPNHSGILCLSLSFAVAVDFILLNADQLLFFI